MRTSVSAGAVGSRLLVFLFALAGLCECVQCASAPGMGLHTDTDWSKRNGQLVGPVLQSARSQPKS